MSFEILEQSTTYAPLNTTIDADADYNDNQLSMLSSCNCGGGDLSEINMNTWLGLSLLAFGAMWLWMSKPDLEDEMETQRLRTRMGLNRG